MVGYLKKKIIESRKFCGEEKDFVIVLMFRFSNNKWKQKTVKWQTLALSEDRLFAVEK